MNFPQDRMKTALIVLTLTAVGLGILTIIVVFWPVGSSDTIVGQNNNTSLTLPTSTVSSSTTTIPSGNPNSAPTSTPPSNNQPSTGSFSLNWNEGHEQFSLTNASLQENRLTFTLAIQMGNTSECVPINLRFIADELGTMKAPDSPSTANFIFPDTQTCNGTPGSAYSESVIFTVDPTYAPFLFNTGGSSDVFFQIATTTTNGLHLTLPQQSG